MKNFFLVLFFLFGSLSNNIAFSMTNKISYSTSQNINNFSKNTKKSSLKTTLSRKTRAMQVLTLPTRYVVNTIIMTIFQFKNSVFVKKAKANGTDYLMLFAFLATFGLTTYYFIWLGEVLLIALLAGIVSVVGLAFLIVLWDLVTGNIRC